jgi:hypothetical protein
LWKVQSKFRAALSKVICVTDCGGFVTPGAGKLTLVRPAEPLQQLFSRTGAQCGYSQVAVP